MEYPLVVNEKLKGSLDYFLESNNSFLIVEAKKADLKQGFLQLAVELIALDQWLDKNTDYLYDIVFTGNIWKLGILERQTKTVIQDLNLFRVPADLEDLLRIIIDILQGENYL